MNIQFTPGNFFVGNCAAIRSVGGGAVADLAEITPERNIVHFQILVHHGHNANWEIAGNTATNLEEANAFAAAVVLCTSRSATPYIQYRFSWWWHFSSPLIQ